MGSKQLHTFEEAHGAAEPDRPLRLQRLLEESSAAGQDISGLPEQAGIEHTTI